MKLLIRRGRVIDPAHKRDEITDLLIEDGRVSRIGKISKSETTGTPITVIEAAGKWVIPGLVDLHVHLRQPGFEYKETIRSGTESAAAGGFTSVCCMPNTQPVCDNEAVVRLIRDIANREGIVNVHPIGAITKGSLGKELAAIGEMVEAGCVAISDDGRPVVSAEVMRRAMEYALAFDLLVIDHCEDACLFADGVMNEGSVSLELGLRGIPKAAEEVMVHRNLVLAELTGARIHLAHVSSAGSVRAIREAKARGVRATAETCPHYFTLTDEAVSGYNTDAKMNPPLRTHSDQAAIRQGLADGTIDVIATDHAPHSPDEKEREFDQAPFGIVGLETALPLSLKLVADGVLSPARLVEALSVQPARITRIDRGRLGLGEVADITVIDPEREWKVDARKFKSKSRNTPFDGWKVRGLATHTIVGGKIVHSADEVGVG